MWEVVFPMPQPPWFVRFGQGRFALGWLLGVTVLAAILTAVVADSPSAPAEVVTETVRVREIVTAYRVVEPDERSAPADDVAAEQRRLKKLARRLKAQQDKLADLERSLQTQQRRLDRREDDLSAAQPPARQH